MIKETLEKIEVAIEKIQTLETENKKELTGLLNTLKTELQELSKSHGEEAHSIAGFTEVVLHEASRKQKAPELQELSLEGLSNSVRGFEVSHPRLCATVNDICNLLASIGI